MTEKTPDNNHNPGASFWQQTTARIREAWRWLSRQPVVAGALGWLRRRAWYIRFANWAATQTRWQLTYKLGAAAAVAGFLFAVFFSFMVYKGVFGALPTYGELSRIRNNQASEVYADDEVLLGKYYVENRVNASFGEISPNVINALIATEDARFFEHSGIDLRAWVRVLVKTILLSDDSAGGGSTLSQQLAKNLYPRRDYWLFSMLVNKIKEMFVARRLERIYTKEELLNLYLNTVAFSENIFGIKVAAQRFFDKSPKDLELHEAAVLVGMLKGPSLFNPVKYPDRSLQRRNTVLNQMEKYGYIKTAVCEAAKTEPLEIKYFKEGNNQGLATYFREQLRLELEEVLKDYEKPDGSPYNLYTDGLKIYTTINGRMQRYAEQSVRDYMPDLQRRFLDNWSKNKPWEKKAVIEWAMKQSERYKSLKAKGYSDAKIEQIFSKPVRMKLFSWDGEIEKEISPLDSIKYYLSILHAGLIAVEPQTGLVRAWVGGIDHSFFKYDHVKSVRHVGSTIKPVIYTQALRSGVMPCEYLPNQLTAYEDYNGWEPRNADGEYGGVYSMEGALSKSVNTVSVALLMRAGLDEVRKLIRDMGVEKRVPAHPSIALGTVEASLYDMARVYSTFANQGRRPALHYLDRVETADGKVIVKFNRPNPRNFPEILTTDESLMAIRMMKSVVDSGTARRLGYEFGLRGKVAAKTGTTQNHSDGWLLGFNARLVVGVWIGAETPLVHFRSMSAGQAANTALPIWGRFMRKIYNDGNLENWQNSYFPPLPDSLAALMACPPFFEEMPVIVDLQEGESLNDWQEFNRLFDEYDREQLKVIMEENDREDMESLSQYADRLRRILERDLKRDERREKRKNFWGNLLFGNKKKEEAPTQDDGNE